MIGKENKIYDFWIVINFGASKAMRDSGDKGYNDKQWIGSVRDGFSSPWTKDFTGCKKSKSEGVGLLRSKYVLSRDFVTLPFGEKRTENMILYSLEVPWTGEAVSHLWRTEQILHIYIY